MRIRFIALAIAAVIVFAFSGCSLEFASIETLMRPPLTATERELGESIEKLLGNNISLRSPASGAYHSAITLHDLDGDKNDEAIIFYVNDNDNSAVRMCVLKKNSGGWQLVSDFAGNGSGIYSVDFCDLNNDGGDDMLVSWYLFEDKVNKTLTVYSSSRKGNEINFSACATEPYNHLCIADVFTTGEKQLVLTYTDASKKTDKTHIRLMSLNSDNRVVLVSETTLDDRIVSTTSILADLPAQADGPRFFVDAVVSDNKLITEILTWDSNRKNFIPLITSVQQYSRRVTMRSSNLYSFDIDGDGLIEIPMKKPLNENKNGDTSVGYLLEWYGFDGTNLVLQRSYVVNVRNNYRIFVPQELQGKVFVRGISSTTWSFVSEVEELLFTVAVYNAQDWKNNSTDGKEALLTTSSKVYACEITEAGRSSGITAQKLSSYFSLNS